MVAATLDTLKAAKRLKDAGVPEPHAEAFVQTLREAQETGLAQLATNFDLAEIRGELTLVKWMLGFNLALSVAILLRLLVAQSLPETLTTGACARGACRS
jgi:hypothetical protein